VLVGSMNSPVRTLEAELTRIAETGFSFVDLTLEPPSAWPADGATIARLLRDRGLSAIGHTAYYLPIASPFEDLREAARREFGRMLDVFAAAGITLVNVHPDPVPRLLSREEARARNAEAIGGLVDDAKERGVALMVENLGSFAAVDDLRPILDASPELRFHLDVGHTNLARARAEPTALGDLLSAFGDRLAHVHVSDNLGVDDLHLPLGAGNVDWPAAVGALKRSGWDGTVTLEVFSEERAHLETSRRLWLEWWETVDPG
jgi:sugar phosphate isomerase/epimerase